MYIVFLLFFIFSVNFACAVDVSVPIKIVTADITADIARVASEKFGQYTVFRAPTLRIVEDNGIAINLFCESLGDFDVLAVTRQMNDAELHNCFFHDANEIEKIFIGYIAAVVASKNVDGLEFERYDLFQAVSDIVEYNGSIIKNPFYDWGQINNNLSISKLSIYSGGATSSFHKIFVEQIVRTSCVSNLRLRNIYRKFTLLSGACGKLRKDKYMGSDNSFDRSLTLEKMSNESNMLGIFDFNFFMNNKNILKPALIEGIKPNLQNILNNKYAISCPVYFYIKGQNISNIPGMKEFMEYLTSKDSVGRIGHLTKIGVINSGIFD